MENRKTVKVMTFNIQHGRNYQSGKIDLPLMAKTVSDLSADIIVMQEVYGKGSEEPFVGQAEEIAKSLGYYSYYAAAIKLKKGPYGNALISRYPIISANTVPVPSGSVKVFGRYFEDRCIIDAKVDTPLGVLRVLGAHFGLQPEEAKLAVDKIVELSSKEAELPTVFLGDLNFTPENEVFLPIREIYEDTDKYFTGENNFTFSSDKPYMKIDYIFTNSKIKTQNVDIPHVIAADHLPVTADIEF